MKQSLRVDTDRLREQAPELSSLADEVRRQLSTLESALTESGEFWGRDEPGKLFAESYAPGAENDLAGLRNLGDHLQRMSEALTGTANAFEYRDQENATTIDDSAHQGFTQAPAPADFAPDSTHRTPDPAPPATTPAGQESGAGTARGAQGPGDSSPLTGADRPAFAGQPDGSAQPVGPVHSAPTADSPPAFAHQPGRAGQAVSPDITQPPMSAPGGGPAQGAQRAPASSMAADKEKHSTTPSSGTPWARSASPRPSPAATPWPRSAVSPAPRRILSPGREAVPPGVAAPRKNEHPGRAPKTAPPKKTPAKTARPQRKRSDTQTDAAAMATARALAARHGLQIVGFENSGIGQPAVAELATAIDDAFDIYPFITLDGLAIADLGAHTTSLVTWHRPDGEPGTWITLDRHAVADPAVMTERIRAMVRDSAMVADAVERPMYSVISHDLGRIVVAEVPQTRQRAQRALITEYHRISGPWDASTTLAEVVVGYRHWRDRLNWGTRTHWDSGAGLIAGFAEVRIRGTAACAPARTLHRIVVEAARTRSDARHGRNA
ncbi:hypothetical protein [Nocardia callitridis]|uniref:WXG100 family type VII secretion target n=1 Tax=Nocardia callitridis TaxID=648753 RepID=A0ABP9JVC2_9NOCA